MDGYKCFCKIEEKNAQRGVLISVKESLRAQEIHFKGQDRVKDTVWVEISLQDGDRLLIGCVYRSPNNTKDENDMLYGLIKNAIGVRPLVLLAGDFNHPEIDWEKETSPTGENHKATIFLVAVVRDNFMYQHVRNHTHYRAEQTPTLIDLILTSEEGMVNNIVHDAPFGKSHHQVLKFEIRTSVQSKERGQDTRLIYSRADFDGWREYIRKLNMSDRLQDMDVMEGWKSFLDTHVQSSTGQICSQSRRKPQE